MRLAAILAATLAAVSWSLGFIAPLLVRPYTPFDLALVQFLFAGLLGAALLLRRRGVAATLRAADWASGCALGLIGYVAYFLAVMGAALYAGPVVAPAFLSLVPVVLAVAGNLRHKAVSWRQLAQPLALTTAGLLLVNAGGLLQSAAAPPRSLQAGVPLALLAVALWTTFGLLNDSALARRPSMQPPVWAALIMVGACAATLLLLPLGLWLGVFALPRLGLQGPGAGALLAWGAVLAAVSNVAAAAAWTYASQRLPVALTAQLITLEPASATILGLIVHRRWPSIGEVLGMMVLIGGVLFAIRTFSAPAAIPGSRRAG